MNKSVSPKIVTRCKSLKISELSHVLRLLRKVVLEFNSIYGMVLDVGSGDGAVNLPTVLLHALEALVSLLVGKPRQPITGNS